MNNYDKEDLDDFLAKVADVNSTVGAVQIIDFETQHWRNERGSLR